ncbi:MAG: sulfatase [Puniceicoccaceae bacterium]
MKKKPNIILINCDDLGYGDLGCYGSTRNQTPALDRLASEGMHCTRFYMASSICTPSRAGLLTGCYPQRISMNRVLFPGEAEGLNPSEETLASKLKGKGYETALIGKWHLGDQPEFSPTKHGFDTYFGLPYSNDMGIQAGNPQSRIPLPLMKDDAICELQPDQSSLTDRYVQESINFIEKSLEKEKPFFLYFAHMYVHLPLYVPEDFRKKSKNGRYGAAVACIDWAWDQLDKTLKRLSIEKNTIVLFTSDNGCRAQDGFGSNLPFRGGKFSTWEGGFRLPLLVRWPEAIPAGSTTDSLLCSLDLMPTLVEWSGAVHSSKNPIDGTSQTDLLGGNSSNSTRSCFAYYSQGNLAAITDGRWKLHFCMREDWDDPLKPFSALFDLSNDPSEKEDVRRTNPDVIKRMEAFANIIREELGDAFKGIKGKHVRPCGKVHNPAPIATDDEDHPYVIAEYDLMERG